MLLNYGAGEGSWESPGLSKEIKPVNPKGNQPWIFIGRTDAEAPIPWPPDVEGQLTGKDPDARIDWGQEEKGVTEDEMVGWHHQLSSTPWAKSWRWWRTGKPGVLQSMGSQRTGHDRLTTKAATLKGTCLRAENKWYLFTTSIPSQPALKGETLIHW